ncbi:beta-lactamase/transpeptidase-like protein [Cadophora sp. DSE1049]|nr:beta-lactamase/transpeptidase-like protein [Cadophora sp. DSE1049]
MKIQKPSLKSLLSAILLMLPSLSSGAGCPPSGPLLSRPITLHTSPAIQNATQNLTSLFNSAVSGDIQVPWAVSNYLIGSISKLFSDLILLRTGLRLDDPVTKYLPELKSVDSPVRWENITLGSLGDHLSGIPTTYGYPEIYDLVPLYQLLGFPPLPESAWPSCGIIGLNPGCTRQQLLENMKEIHPVSAPLLRPIYSSHSFTILSYALQNATGQNYTQLLDNLILKPLNLTNTGVSPGDDETAVIPPVQNSWGSEYGDNAPVGGLFSSTHDLSTLLREIMSLNPTLLTHLKTVVGIPWEIYRAQKLTPAHPHTIDIYTKSGGAFGYASILGVVEQYGLGFAIVTAGGKGVEAQNALEGTLMRVLMPVIEEVTRQEACVYTGNYTNASDDVDATLQITIEDGPGLLLTELARNGSDIFDAFHTIWNAQPVGLGNLTGEFRLYPTDVAKELTVDGKVLVEEDWRMNWDTTVARLESELPQWEELEEFCTAWQTSDAIVYGGESADRFVFVREREDGTVVEVRVPSLRLNLTRES